MREEVFSLTGQLVYDLILLYDFASAMKLIYGLDDNFGIISTDSFSKEMSSSNMAFIDSFNFIFFLSIP